MNADSECRATMVQTAHCVSTLHILRFYQDGLEHMYIQKCISQEESDALSRSHFVVHTFGKISKQRNTARKHTEWHGQLLTQHGLVIWHWHRVTVKSLFHPLFLPPPLSLSFSLSLTHTHTHIHKLLPQIWKLSLQKCFPSQWHLR